MAIESLWLRDFGPFEDATLEFCSGLNVIIGENATGKSHAMKTAYSLLRAAPHRGVSHDPRSFLTHLEDKLKGFFGPRTTMFGVWCDAHRSASSHASNWWPTTSY